MIASITVDGVACYKKPATLTTDRRVNLIYGLNGTGKSTLTNFLYNRSDPAYSRCSVDGLTTEEVLVYNQRFINDNFYESDTLKGIFTLSRVNKEAEEQVRQAEQLISKFEAQKKGQLDSVEAHKRDLSQKSLYAEEKTWEIKTKYAGGDRVLEYCLDGLKGRKATLFTHLAGVPKPSQQPAKTTSNLKREVEVLQGDNAKKYALLDTIDFNVERIETSPLLQKVILGNENSPVSELIQSLGNSDWVRQGLDYISSDFASESQPCPFCQERTVTEQLYAKIHSYFDESYERDIKALGELLSAYVSAIDSVAPKNTDETNPFFMEIKAEYDKRYDEFVRCTSLNKAKIEEKLKTPSQQVMLTNAAAMLSSFNALVAHTNNAISTHNAKIDNREAALEDIKNQFWSLMRWEYDQTLSAHTNDKAVFEKKIADCQTKIAAIEGDIAVQREVVKQQQKNTVNIDEAIANINNGLIELGIDGFHIQKHSDALYAIAREGACENTFRTLSEGEKMIISFLYFRELCKGKSTASSLSNRKIVFIDDPISSLSHIYVFSVGELIKKDFFGSSSCDQIFVLTHSLYFFYEMVNPNHEKRKETQKLFRMTKNSDGSQISVMKYEEIQNDYHSYWFVVADEKHPPALIANCMRNIVEYFFGFIEKRGLNNVFQKPELQEVKYQAFRRYIDRESHSLGQNILDLKEFNYADFREALRLVFLESGYIEHYNEMMKLGGI